MLGTIRTEKELQVSLFSTLAIFPYGHTLLCHHNSRVMQGWGLIVGDRQYLLKMHIKSTLAIC